MISNLGEGASHEEAPSNPLEARVRFHETFVDQTYEDVVVGPRPFVINLPTHADPDARPEPCQGPCCVRSDDTGLFE